MGDTNQLLYIQRYQEDLTGPYLEVGSKDYGSTQDLRQLFSDRDKYIGADIQAGPGVDIVLDFTQNIEEIDATLGGIRFGTIFCLSVLEHCEQPFKMAENLTALMMPRGKICLSVPFSWKIHGYPSDYWRFTPSGVKKLFPKLVFESETAVIATSRKSKFHSMNDNKSNFHAINDNIGKISFSSTAHIKSGRLLKGISIKILRGFAKIGILRWLTGYRYVLAPTSIYMIGVLSNDQAVSPKF
jgi:hypothetical protein